MNKAIMIVGAILILGGGFQVINSSKSDELIAYEAGSYQLSEILDDLPNSARGIPGYRTSDYQAKSIIREDIKESRLIGFISLFTGILLIVLGFAIQKKE
jgi:hypothetical protein